MKNEPFKLLSLLICTFLSVGFTACINTNSSDNGGNNSSSQSSFDSSVSSASISNETLPENPSDKGVVYDISADGTYAEVIGYAGDQKYIIISDTYEGLPVTHINYFAFYQCFFLKGVEIPNSVTRIGAQAFSNCFRLTSVVIPDSVTSIGDWAFDFCDSLTSVFIPDSVTSIGVGAFNFCSSLTSITFNGTIEQWDEIEKGSSWNDDVPATEVVCSDGTVAI